MANFIQVVNVHKHMLSINFDLVKEISFDAENMLYYVYDINNELIATISDQEYRDAMYQIDEKRHHDYSRIAHLLAKIDDTLRAGLH